MCQSVGDLCEVTVILTSHLQTTAFLSDLVPHIEFASADGEPG